MRRLQYPIQHSFPFSQLWAEFVPPKLYVFLWKFVLSILPTDNNVRKCGIYICSRCCCCTSPQEESDCHLLLHSNLALSTWTYFKQLYSADPQRYPSGYLFLTQVIQETNVSSFQGKVSLLIVFCWLWQIWCERNHRKYDGKYRTSRTLYYKIIHSVNNTRFKHCSSAGDLSVLNELRHLSVPVPEIKRRKPMITRWIPPPI